VTSRPRAQETVAVDERDECDSWIIIVNPDKK
jgi:hypothetical protein